MPTDCLNMRKLTTLVLLMMGVVTMMAQDPMYELGHEIEKMQKKQKLSKWIIGGGAFLGVLHLGYDVMGIGKIEETISAEVLADITEWIKKLE